MFSWTLLCTICFFLPQYLSKKDADRCSQYEGYDGYPLVECPSYDIDPNCYECYDVHYKEKLPLEYFCWNRLDNDEAILKNLTISTAYFTDDVLFQQLNQPFTSMVRDNGTHTICSSGSNKNWAYPYDDFYFNCPTNSLPVAEFVRCDFEYPLW